ncbi:alpha-1,3-mannosyl-glycoprotein 4-beta-N-acetylglucosaminyltransferase B-like [Lethenteron reissneri]|uniref:alpha-1,3-mannosyl-glycoprotein 4-beta-N-acetylglucosaminyltransferase B-like n=1 Tax=Lethenteron reissneri TaxID=7753 RepID=UPI002AB6EB30|nr:alpha-1,3-mannosyl-glycoprotein 4-beta-N-acetylglucosaminyltransferase B-like [Lethenteron reissneri]
MRLRNGTVATFLVLATFVSVSLYTTWQTQKDDEVAGYQRELQSVHERLLLLETKSAQRSRELASVLHGLQRGNRSNDGAAKREKRVPLVVGGGGGGGVAAVPGVSGGGVVVGVSRGTAAPREAEGPMGGIFYYLPHLLLPPGRGLAPAVHLTQGRMGVSVVLGVPTVRRAVQTYLMDTLASLTQELSPNEKRDCLIIVFIAETDLSYVNTVVEQLKKGFQHELDTGLLEVISPPVGYYPDMGSLKQTFGDSLERVRWRTKQNLDFSFLMLHAQPRGRFFVQLEDDIVARPNYLTTMKNFAEQQPSDEWIILEFSQLGFIGKLFKASDLNPIVEFFLMFHKDKPIDWLLDHFLWVKTCNPEKDAKHCERQKANLRVRFKPSLFQHVGTHSSLSGKIQKLKDRDFGKQPLHKAHPNPAAEVSTSLKMYQQYTLEKVYLGQDFFWAFTPVAGDFILFRFHEPIRVERYLFRSGNIEHPGDKLFNTSVEVLPSLSPDSGKETLQDTKDRSSKYVRTEDGFFRIGAFVNGAAEGEVEQGLGPITALRLSIITDSPVWVILSEIYIKKAAR